MQQDPNMDKDRYPSRSGGEARLLDRLDPVDYVGDSPAAAPLEPAEVKSYREKGYLVMPQLFDAAEVDLLNDELRRLRTEYADTDDERVIREPRGNAMRSIFEVHRLSPLMERLVSDARLVEIARYLLGGDVYIHQSRLNYKPGFVGKEFYWHSDFETWHVEDGMPAMRALSASISLTDNRRSNGPLMLVAGSHRKYVACPGETPEDHYKDSLRRQEYGVPPHDLLAQLVGAGGIESVTGPAGSVTFFECNVMHGSNSNISPYPRANAFVVYNSVSNKPVAPFADVAPRPAFLAEREDFSPVRPVTGKLRRGGIS